MGYTFTISYYSEVTLEVTIRRDSGYYEAECRHPMTASGTQVSLDGGWFHFSGPTVEQNVIHERASSLTEILDQIAETFYKGTKFYFDKHGWDAHKWFREHLYIAFVIGYLPHRAIRVEVTDELS